MTRDTIYEKHTRSSHILQDQLVSRHMINVYRENVEMNQDKKGGKIFPYVTYKYL
jgi:hypothetical protein